MSDQIEQFESQLQELPKLHRIALYATIFLLFLGGSWYLFGESMSQEIETKESSISSLEKRLQQSIIPLLHKKSRSLKEEILVLNDTSGEVSQKLNFIATKLDELKFIVYNEKETAQILDEILKNSLKNNINIEMIRTKDVSSESETFVVAKESISIIGSGSYEDITLLIHYIDSLKSLLELKRIHINIQEDVTKFELYILHHGVEL